MEKWLQLDPNSASKNRILELKASGTLESLFRSSENDRLEFGTAGLRAAFGPGPLRMNDVTVMQTTKGLMKQLVEEFGEASVKSRGIVIGYDHRASPEWGLTSKRFAEAAASVLLSHGIEKVFLFDDVCPTPFVPFAIQEHRCVAGFMMTASHNPKEDAGFKVYWENACQLVSPKDDLVAAKILEDLSLDPAAVEILNSGHAFKLCKSLSEDLRRRTLTSYCAKVTSRLCRAHSQNSNFTSRRFCYTAMHGVGEYTAETLLRKFGFNNFVSVPEQAKPDYSFPTVKFPNPEEKGALDLACKYALEHDCDLVLANDPDADRLAIAELDRQTQKFYVFSGDEIAMLLAWWELEMFAKRSAADKQKLPAMVVSAVSSGFVKRMGEQKGCEVYEALTGFKWIGTKAKELRDQKNLDVLFSYEEAIGFCIGDVIYDKDGLSACAVFSEMYAHLCLTSAKSSRTNVLVEKLDRLRQEFGYFMTQNGYVKTTSSQVHFERMRNDGRYAIVLGSKAARKLFRVINVRDLNKNWYVDTSEKDGTPKLPFSSLMITYYLEPLGRIDLKHGQYHVRLTLRASGTEPKLKYYVEANGPEKSVAQALCSDVVQHVVLGDLLKGKESDEKSKM